MMKAKYKTKLMARIAAVMLCVSLAAQSLPLNAFAAEEESAQTQEIQENQSSISEESAQEEIVRKETSEVTTAEYSDNGAAASKTWDENASSENIPAETNESEADDLKIPTSGTESSADESITDDESTADEEKLLTGESSTEKSTEEKPPTEESSSTESEPEDKDDSQYPDADRTDLKAAGGSIASIKAKVYDGSPYKPAVKVTAMENGKVRTLVEGLDYRAVYINNVNAGKGTVAVRGNGAYKGEITADFMINQQSIRKLKIIAGSVALKGREMAVLPIYVYDASKLLERGIDYDLPQLPNLASYVNKNASVTLIGKGNYNGTASVKLPVYDAETTQLIRPEDAALEYDIMTYTGKAIKNNNPEVKIGGRTLVKNRDYTVQYQNNINVGTAFVIVTGKGAYKGKVIMEFEIVPAEDQQWSGEWIKDVIYNGKLQKPIVKGVKSGGRKLTNGKDFTISYTNNLHAGKAIVTITGKGNYEGAVIYIGFKILPQKISKASVKGTKGNLVVTYGGKTLKEGVHFETPSYDESSIKGKNIKVTIKGKGDFEGSVTKTVKVQ